MIIRKIEVIDVTEIERKGKAKLGVAALLISLPWCCVAPGVLSLLGLFVATKAARILFNEALIPLFIFSLVLLGTAHYQIYFKNHGSRASRIIVGASTIGTLALWAFRFGIITA